MAKTMWHVFVLVFLVAARFCLAAGSTNQESTKLYTKIDIDGLVNTFTAYRNNGTLQKFVEAVGDMGLLEKEREGFDFVKMYLNGKDERFFDAVRRTFWFCSKKGNEHLMSQFKEFMKNTAAVEAVEKLFHCLPFTPDFREEERELVEMLGDIWASKNQSSYDVWQRDPTELRTRTYWTRKGPRDEKKYFLAMLKYEFVSASHEKRVKLLKRATDCLGMADLLELQRFLLELFGTVYSLGDIDSILLGVGKKSNMDRNGNSSLSHFPGLSVPQSGSFNNLPQDVWICLFSQVDWRTVMYSIPYVNKAIYKFITESRILSDCPDFQKLLREQPRDGSPERFYIFERPWNAIFPTYPKFLNHYILGNEPKRGFRTLAHVIRGYGSDYELINSKFSTVCEHPCGFSVDSLATILDYFVDSKSIPMTSLFEDIPIQLIINSIGKMNNGKLMVECFYTSHSDLVFDRFFGAVLKVDYLDWPEDLIQVVEDKIKQVHNVHVPLPFTPDKIQKCGPEQLKSIITILKEPLITIKIFNAISEMNPQSMNIITLEDIEYVLNRCLSYYPTAMTPKQFGLFVKLAIELHGENEEFHKCLSKFTAKIAEHKLD